MFPKPAPSRLVGKPGAAFGSFHPSSTKIENGISKTAQAAIEEQLQSVFQLRPLDAQEMNLFARWLAAQSRNPSEMARRLIRRTLTLGGRDTLPDLMRLGRAVGEADTGTASIDTLHIIESIKQLNA